MTDTKLFYPTDKLMIFPVLDTKRLSLDSLQASDSQSIFELFSEPEVVSYYDLSAFSEKEQAANLIQFFANRFETGEGIRWAIRLKDTKKLIGTCGFNSWSPKMKNAVIGYDLQKQYWGRGIVTEAVNAIVKTAFSGKLKCEHIHRIQADTVPGNIASEYVLKKVGFREEGIRRQSAYWKGEFHDLKCFGLLRSEYSEV